MNEQQISVVTGGTSGIGAACVTRLAARGDAVIILDLDDAWKDHDFGHSIAAGYRCNVADEVEVQHTAAAILERFGVVHNLVNSAGIIQRPLSPETLPLSDWDRVVAVDQRGTYVCCLEFGAAMARQGGGAIVNIASITGHRSAPLHAYAPAKAAVISITQCLASEWGRSGVRLNSISPGYTLTPALQDAIDRGERDVSSLTAPTALGRMVLPEEVAHTAAFLTSKEAAAITGIDIPVDAGWLVGNGWQTYGGLPPARVQRGADDA